MDPAPKAPTRRAPNRLIWLAFTKKEVQRNADLLFAAAALLSVEIDRRSEAAEAMQLSRRFSALLK